MVRKLLYKKSQNGDAPQLEFEVFDEQKLFNMNEKVYLRSQQQTK